MTNKYDNIKLELYFEIIETLFGYYERSEILNTNLPGQYCDHVFIPTQWYDILQHI